MSFFQNGKFSYFLKVETLFKGVFCLIDTHLVDRQAFIPFPNINMLATNEKIWWRVSISAANNGMPIPSAHIISFTAVGNIMFCKIVTKTNSPVANYKGDVSFDEDGSFNSFHLQKI